MTVTDCARFLAEDPGELVAASFACPWCLAQPASLAVEVGTHEGVAHVCCPECAERWDVALDAGQVMRLSLAPPSALPVRFGRNGGTWAAA